MRLKFGILSLFILCTTLVFAQEKKVENLPLFSQKRIHFGFTLGINSAGFTLDRKPINFNSDSLKTMSVDNQTGFNLGIVSALHFNEFFSLRFIPTLTFAQRNIEYTFFNRIQGNTYTVIKPIESTYIELPMLLKYRSKRLNNFAAYLVGGGKYVLDLASKEDVDNALEDEILVKQKSSFFAYEVGIGTDFFLPYFKFSIEGKMSYGLQNMIVKDQTIFSDPIERLKPKMFILSLHFEG